MIEELRLPIRRETTACLVLEDHQGFDQGVGLENSNGLAEIAVNSGSAASRLGLEIGTTLRWC